MAIFPVEDPQENVLNLRCFPVEVPQGESARRSKGGSTGKIVGLVFNGRGFQPNLYRTGLVHHDSAIIPVEVPYGTSAGKCAKFAMFSSGGSARRIRKTLHWKNCVNSLCEYEF